MKSLEGLTDYDLDVLVKAVKDYERLNSDLLDRISNESAKLGKPIPNQENLVKIFTKQQQSCLKLIKLAGKT